MTTRTCKKCGFQSGSQSVFMSHIRQEHPWDSSKNFHKTKKTKKTRKVKTKELIVRQILNNGAAHFEKPQLSALDLLMKLKEQRDLIISVVNIVEGVINQ